MTYVARQSGSTRSLANVKSHLRVHCRLMDVPWLSESAAARVILVEKNMRFYDASVGNRKRPLVTSILVAIACRLPYQSDVVALQLLTTLFLGHDGLLRGGELWGGLQVEDVVWQWDKKGFSLLLRRTKTCRTGTGVRVTYAVKESKLHLSGVMLLRRWFDERRLWGRPNELIFPGFSKVEGGRFIEDQLKRGCKATWVAYLRLTLKSLGYCDKEYAGHSLRAGGATDLFNSGMVLASIMKVGRWETVEAALVYFRDDLKIAQEAGAMFAAYVAGVEVV